MDGLFLNDVGVCSLSDKGVDSDCTDTLIAFNARQDPDVTWDRAGSLSSSTPQAEAIAQIGHNGGPPLWAVRRLTPLECERLQGFPDHYTLVPHGRGMIADDPRYKALGNSMACNVMRWIGRRIEMAEAMGLGGVAA